MELSKLDIKSAKEGLEKKEFSAVELVTSCLEQIKKKDPGLNAFITICEQEALKQAEGVDKQFSNLAIEQLSNLPLLGIPIAIKDLFCTKGIRTTAGSKVLEDYVPVYDATVVERLKKAGAIIIGKTNMDAWGHGSSGENSDFGPTRNPWNPEYVSGGSSSGSAAAIASDMCLAACGTDTGGSIRLPASFCNVVGLKPTYGRVPRYGVISMASSLDSIGHLTKNVYDSALMLNLTAGWDGKDATCPKQEVPDYTKGLENGTKGLKIGVPKEYFVQGISPEVKRKTEEAVAILEKLGAQIIDVSLPHTKYGIAAYYLIQSSEVSSNLARFDGIRYGNGRDKFGDEAKRRIMLGTYALSAGYYDQYYLKAQKVRTLIKADFDNAFKSCDLLIAPISPTLPFKIGEKTDDPLQMYLSDIFAVTTNLAGIPGLSVPIGFENGLPVGIQLSGPQFSEELLFKAGYALEQEQNVEK
ncbi:MAG: Asp-tRNA(Asn)/Glu-tRNA(Gln) amidotransferase subunit GatA [bacterium]|nr:Asp-tRNA(Asn)/Glu-tRNA(Gln) amidotransferase subunit GatA [bacterium]